MGWIPIASVGRAGRSDQLQMFKRAARPVHNNSHGFIALVYWLGGLWLQLASAQTPDDFNTNQNVGPVYAVTIQSDGKVLVGGPTQPILRLNADGTRDASYYVALQDSFSGSTFVTSLVTQPDGKTLVGGGFTSMSGLTRTRLGRLMADGSVDVGFFPAVNDHVYAIALQTDGQILVGGRFTTVANQPHTNLVRLNSTGTPDAGFIPAAQIGASGGQVFSLAVQEDGKILVGGWFTTLNGQPRSYLGRLNPEGTLDAGFDPGADNTVLALAVQADGKILVGGNFTNLAGMPRNFIGRLNPNGTLDANFNPAASAPVTSFGLQANGKILVGGSFTNLAGEARNYIGRLNPDGTPDLGFDPGADGWTAAGLQADGKILVAGGFTTLGGQPRPFLGRLTNPEPVTQNLSYAGSTITWLRGGSSPEIWCAMFDHATNGGPWTSVGIGSRVPGGWQLPGVVLPLGGTLRARGQVAGMANTASGWVVETMIGAAIFVTQPVSRTNNFGDIASFGVEVAGPGPLGYQWLKDGIPLADATGVAGVLTPTLTLTNLSKLNEGGYCLVVTNSSGSITSAVATLKVLDPVFTSQSIGGNCEVGQNVIFSVMAGGTGLSYQWMKDGGPLLQQTNTFLSFTNLQLGDAGAYRAVVTGTYGSATSSVGILVVNAAKLDPNFNATINGWVSPVVVQPDGKIIIGGGFTTVSGQSRGHVARVNSNSTLDTSFANPNANDDVYALALQPDGKLLVGGEFTTLGGQTRYALGRLNTNGTLDTTFSTTVFSSPPYPQPAVSYRAQAILLQPDGKVVVGGRSTTTFNGQPLIGGFLLRLNPNGTSDGTFSTGGIGGGPVSTLGWQPDGNILVGGLFSSVGGQTRNQIARLGPNGALDTSFNPGLAGTNGITPIALAFAVQPDGKILVGGSFITIAGQAQTNLARLNPDGTLDATFDCPAGGSSASAVYSLALQADGKILVGGIYTTLAGALRSRIGRINADGALESAFNPGANGDVYGLAIQPDGNVLVAGFFNQLSGKTRSYLGRLNNTSPASQSLSYSNTTLNWSRGGTSPEVWRTTFESSTNGTNWIMLGNGTRISGGWQLTGGLLPPAGTIRARGYTGGGGYNAASWFVEDRLLITPNIFAHDGLLGFQSNRFGFSVGAPSGTAVVIEASTNCVQWSPILTNLVGAIGTALVQDLNSGNYPRRFYRARFYLGSLPVPLFRPGTAGFSGGDFHFQIEGIIGQTVVIETSTNLMFWSAATTNILGAEPWFFRDATSTNFPSRFYRARRQ